MHQRVLFKSKLISQSTVLEGKEMTEERNVEGLCLDGQTAEGKHLKARQRENAHPKGTLLCTKSHH